jgi:dTDP-4-amino-4,6-dideoxygalactose transaminase
MRSVAMLDLRREYELYGEEVRAAVHQVLESGQFVLGPAVTEFEKSCCRRFGADHAIAVSSGTDALLCALMALGVGPGDEVIVPSFTFFATAGTVARLGAKPVFVDIDARTFNMDPALLEPAITRHTKVVIPVHLFGQCADMDAINGVAHRHGLKVLEDAAQAIGARYRNRYAGTLADAACFSFYPTKNLGGIGEGGMILTFEPEFAERCRQMRNHGESSRYHHEWVGGNFRLDSIQCAALQVKLNYLDEFNQRRRRLAARYDGLLRNLVTTPFVADGCDHVYHQYSILSDDRDELAVFLKSRGVASAVYYPVPMHRQRCFQSPGCGGRSLPVTEDICRRVLSLPGQPMLVDEDVEYVAACVREFVAPPRGDGRAEPVGSVVRSAEG